jgi:hypothetical protein
MSTSKLEFDSARLLPLAVVRRPFTSRAPGRRFKRRLERTVFVRPLAYLNVQVDGRETSYFEWLGAGIYCANRRDAAQNGSPLILHELHYGFSESFFCLRVDAIPGSFSALGDFEFRIILRGSQELRLLIGVEKGRFAGCLLDTEDICILGPHEFVEVAFEKILEVKIGRRLIALAGQTSLMLQVALWQGSLPMDVLPAETALEVKLGTDAFAWPAQ